MAVKFTNNAKTTLASGINSSVTTATVTDGSVFPTLAAGEHFYCTFDDGTNNEIVKVTARSGNTLTIIRGVDNTTARSFSSGDAAELRATSALLTDIQENIAAKSANQTVYNTTTASSATDYDIGIDPSVEANAMVFLNGVMQHHDTFSFSGSTLTFDTAPPDGMALEVIVDNLINLQSSNLTVDTFTAADVGGNPQTDFTLSDAPAAEDNLLVFIDGVFQDQDAYTISNQTLTITDGVTADFGVTVYVINPVNIGTPSDNTVTSSKLSGNITMPADLTVTGDVAFDSPTFVVDNANSRVGIGTASPSTLLDIVGDVKMSANLTVDTDTLHVDATNNRVGIGETTVNSKLEIKQGSGNWYEGIRINRSSNTTQFGTFSNNSGATFIGAADSAGGNNNAIIFGNSTNGTTFTERARISSDGNVGIGTTSPSEKLSTVGNINIGNNDSSNPFSYLRLGATQYGAADIKPENYDFHRVGLSFHVDNTADDTINPTEAMRIDSTGNVGINTSNPTSYANSQAALVIEDTSSPAIVWSDTGQARDWFAVAQGSGLYFNYADGGGSGGASNVTDVLVLDNSGNVGIGTSNPNHDLHIQSTDPTLILAQSGSINNANSGRILFAESPSYTTTNSHFEIKYDGLENHLYFGSPIDGSTDLFVVGRDGNVGIGQTSPYSHSSFNSLSLGGTSGKGGLIQIKHTNDTARGYLYAQSDAITLESVDTNIIRFVTNAAERARLDTSGRLLLGITSASGAGASVDINGIEFGRGYINIHRDDTAQIKSITFGKNGSEAGNITTTSQTFYNSASDYRLKENVDYDFNALDRVAQLKPARFNFIVDADTTVDGFIAHEVQDIVPEAVTGEKDAEEMQCIDQSKLVPLLTKAIQEQQTQIETLKQEIREIREGG